METSIKLFMKELSDKKYNPLPKEEQYNLGLEYQSTKNPIIKDKLIQHNLRYAVKLAYGWSNQYPIEDALSICLESLTQVPDVWNPKKGTFLTLYKQNTLFSFQRFEIKEAHTIKLSQKEGRKPVAMISTASTISHSSDGKGITVADSIAGDYIDFDSVLDHSNELKEAIWNEVHEDCYNRLNIRGFDNKQTYDILRGKFAEKELRVYCEAMGEMYGVTRQSINQSAKSACKRMAKNAKLRYIYDNELNNLR